MLEKNPRKLNGKMFILLLIKKVIQYNPGFIKKKYSRKCIKMF